MKIISGICLAIFLAMVTFWEGTQDLTKTGFNSPFILNLLFLGFVVTAGFANHRHLKKKDKPMQFLFLRLGILFLIAYAILLSANQLNIGFSSRGPSFSGFFQTALRGQQGLYLVLAILSFLTYVLLAIPEVREFLSFLWDEEKQKAKPAKPTAEVSETPAKNTPPPPPVQQTETPPTTESEPSPDDQK